MIEEKEVWKDVEGYEGLYRVSNYGRVMSLLGRKKQILKPVWQKRTGYLHITLYKNKRPHQFGVHRLVAQAFCERLERADVVNHVDNDTQNNCASNLEWCTQKHNVWHSAIQGRRDKALEIAHNAARNVVSKPVKAVSIDGNMTLYFNSQSDAARQGFDSSAISKCCRGVLHQHKGYRWENWQ